MARGVRPSGGRGKGRRARRSARHPQPARRRGTPEPPDHDHRAVPQQTKAPAARLAALVVLDGDRRGRAGRDRRGGAVLRLGELRADDRPRRQEVFLKRRLALVSALLAASACHDDDSAILLVVVTASGTPRAVTALDVTLTGPKGKAPNSYARDDQQPIAFPT